MAELLPSRVYTDRRAAAALDVVRLERLDARLADARLVVALGALVLAYLAWGAHLLSAWWLLLPLAGFALLALRHDTVLRRRDEQRLVVRFYERGLERLDGRWSGRGKGGERFLTGEHPYAIDLDLF